VRSKRRASSPWRARGLRSRGLRPGSSKGRSRRRAEWGGRSCRASVRAPPRQPESQRRGSSDPVNLGASCARRAGRERDRDRSPEANFIGRVDYRLLYVSFPPRGQRARSRSGPPGRVLGDTSGARNCSDGVSNTPRRALWHRSEPDPSRWSSGPCDSNFRLDTGMQAPSRGLSRITIRRVCL